MFRREPSEPTPKPVQPVSDTELGIAALLLGVALVLATIVVPAFA
jgi:hypothetical protein